MFIRAKNTLTEDSPRTFLASSLAATGTSAYVKNIAGFTDDYAVQIGETGEEQTEIKLLTAAPSGTTLTIGAATFTHPADTPVYCVKYDKMVFKRSTAGTAGTATAMTDGTVSITPNLEYTQFDDTSGSSSYAYKICFRNSALASDAPDSDWLTSTGFSFYSLAKIRQRIKSKALNANKLLDDEIDDWTNEWLETMTNTVIDVNQDYAIGTVDVAFSGTAQYGTITSADFKQVRRSWYTENGSDWYKMTKQQYIDPQPSEDYSTTHPYFHMRGDNVIGRNPSSTSGTIRLSYYKLNAVLNSDADELPVPMRGYTTSFVNHGLAQAYRKDEMIAEATSLEVKAQVDLERFKKELTPRHKTGPSYINIVEAVGESDIDWFW